MKYSLNEFAQQIRKISNNDYDDLNDEELVNLWLKKYPNDRAKIDFSKNNKVKLQTNTTTSSKNFDNSTSNSHKNGGKGFVVFLIVIAVVIGGIILINESTKSRAYNNEPNSGSFENTGSSNTSANIENIKNVEIIPSVSEYVDTSFVVRKLNLSNDYKDRIKKILSDPNPDPEAKNNTVAEIECVKCKWCSQDFTRNATSYGLNQSLLKDMLDVNMMKLGVMMSAFQHIGDGFDGNKEIEKYKSEIYEICANYENGTKYYKSDFSPKPKFCSKKCETEYEYSH